MLKPALPGFIKPAALTRPSWNVWTSDAALAVLGLPFGNFAAPMAGF